MQIRMNENYYNAHSTLNIKVRAIIGVRRAFFKGKQHKRYDNFSCTLFSHSNRVRIIFILRALLLLTIKIPGMNARGNKMKKLNILKLS